MEYIDEHGEIHEHNAESIDGLIDELKKVKEEEASLRELRYNIEGELSAIAANLESDTNTRRVSGIKNTVKISFKENIKWDTKILNGIREEVGDKSFMKYFRVGEYKANARDMKKLAATAGAGEELYAKFNQAKETSLARPYVQIEE